MSERFKQYKAKLRRKATLRKMGSDFNEYGPDNPMGADPDFDPFASPFNDCSRCGQNMGTGSCGFDPKTQKAICLNCWRQDHPQGLPAHPGIGFDVPRADDNPLHNIVPNDERWSSVSGTASPPRLSGMKNSGDIVQGPWRETGVPPHVKVYEPDHEYPGETNEYHYELDPADEFDSIPEQAASRLWDHGLTEPSMAPGWRRGLWYSHPDEGGDYSGHLNGLNAQQEREVWAILQARNDIRNRAPDAPPLGHPLDWTSKRRDLDH